MRFDVKRRERLLTLIETGSTAEAACEAVGVARATLTRWVALGRTPSAPAEAEDFAERYAQVRGTQHEAPRYNDKDPLSDEQLLDVVKASARRGSAESARTLLVRREEQAAELAALDRLDAEDPLSALPGDALGDAWRERQSWRRPT